MSFCTSSRAARKRAAAPAACGRLALRPDGLRRPARLGADKSEGPPVAGRTLTSTNGPTSSASSATPTAEQPTERPRRAHRSHQPPGAAPPSPAALTFAAPGSPGCRDLAFRYHRRSPTSRTLRAAARSALRAAPGHGAPRGGGTSACGQATRRPAPHTHGATCQLIPHVSGQLLRDTWPRTSAHCVGYRLLSPDVDRQLGLLTMLLLADITLLSKAIWTVMLANAFDMNVSTSGSLLVEVVAPQERVVDTSSVEARNVAFEVADEAAEQVDFLLASCSSPARSADRWRESRRG